MQHLARQRIALLDLADHLGEAFEEDPPYLDAWNSYVTMEEFHQEDVESEILDELFPIIPAKDGMKLFTSQEDTTDE
tara:strand:+ start:1782 stop:2012 length:231 start_codon:yes stop_codon:yes gene_type:complete